MFKLLKTVVRHYLRAASYTNIIKSQVTRNCFSGKGTGAVAYLDITFVNCKIAKCIWFNGLNENCFKWLCMIWLYIDGFTPLLQRCIQNTVKHI